MKQSDIYYAANKAWCASLLDMAFAVWLEKQKQAGLYWGA